ncbi:D-alanyl-D-alanine endopeptidase [Azoarcus taiwanensis]|mgnify:CR=1 FL=1|uniref:D-alanyl-D-alanine endopeptidase n=1 Tax=Azoarcus taiwanensis TaxID=666964 RepID=A0A972F8Z9_9RHOO|nr:D-alanyl-D-alanine endopeptidase [Azoarcus taiwanensis]NMG02174.1 D-alanyl-D-alanine endopeptidase [Azoarcus taiwanensis]
MKRRSILTALLGIAIAHASFSVAHANPSNRVQASAPVQVQFDRHGNPVLGSAAFVVANQRTGDILSERAADRVMPIASITKIMTAMVVLDAGQSLSEVLTITADDIDRLKGTGSRLPVGARLTREEMLHIALMSSENRAASALARHYPGGQRAFIEAMNVKARMLGMWTTRFADSTGLDPRNVASAHDLVKLVQAASTYPLIREFSTADHRFVRVGNGQLRYGNSNGLVREPDWSVSLSKTGFIREAGRCLVMQTWVRGEPVIMVLLNSEGRYTRTADAKRLKHWLETTGAYRVAAAPARRGGS